MALLLLLLLPLRYIQPTPKSPEGPTQQEVGKVIPMVFIRCIFRTENTKWPNLNSFRRPIPPTGVSLPSFLAPTSLQGGCGVTISLPFSLSLCTLLPLFPCLLYPKVKPLGKVKLRAKKEG